MPLQWETRTGVFGGLKAISESSPCYEGGAPRFYRIKIADDQQRSVLAFAPKIIDGMKICDTIDEAKAWCEEHERQLQSLAANGGQERKGHA